MVIGVIYVTDIVLQILAKLPNNHPNLETLAKRDIGHRDDLCTQCRQWNRMKQRNVKTENKRKRQHTKQLKKLQYFISVN